MLKERYESAPEEDEVAHDVSDLEHDEVGKCFLFFLDLLSHQMPDIWQEELFRWLYLDSNC